MHQWSKDQLELKSKFLEIGKSTSKLCQESYEKKEFCYDAWNVLAKNNLWKIPFSEKMGGLGGTWWDFIAAYEGLSESLEDIGLLLSGIAHVGLLRAIDIYGTLEQKDYYFSKLFEGAVGATAITEKTGGSDVPRIQVNAQDDKGTLYLSGEKVHITNAPIFDIALVVGRVPSLGDKKDISLFILDKNQKGIIKGPKEVMTGNHSSPTGSFKLDQVELSSINILGNLGEGLKNLYNIISLDRALYGLVSASTAKMIIKNVLERCSNRVSFKKPLIDHQYVQQRITDIQIRQYSTQSVTYKALSSLFRNDSEAVMACSIAKLIGSESMVKNGNDQIIIHGHMGYEKSKFSKYFLDALGTIIAGGTSDIQRLNILNQMKGFV
ncbi:acyl-CoA/acyl-ACP dehydrogenase [bacterium]|nr:acyl-CoA/acyl-ACP dehydrogenase [bacterium]